MTQSHYLTIAEKILEVLNANPEGLTKYDIIVSELEKTKQELQELIKWKAKALVRFPDLLVEPEVLEARVKAADILKEKNRHAEAEDVLAGKLDHIPLMKSMIGLVESLGEMNL